VGTAIAWGSNLFNLNIGGLSLSGLAASFADFGFRVPLPAIDHVFSGFEYVGLLLITAIPFGIYDLVEAIDNVESAAAAGDSFPTKKVLTADGVISLIGCLMGNPFILAVYIGHPGWKAMGGRIGYSVATGAMVIVLCWLGTASVMLAAIPVVSILPILLYIGMLMGSQAFQEAPHRHAPAIVLGIVPHLAAWALGQIKGSLAAAGIFAVSSDLLEKMGGEGVLFHGLEVLGGGAVLSGLVLSAAAVYVIDRRLYAAAAFALGGALLTFFGFMHSEHIGLAQSPTVAIAYVCVAAFLAGCARFAPAVPPPVDPAAAAHGHRSEGEPVQQSA
jgi:AGZA family xanthine/uracil permease-like MFS transporter